VLTERTRNEWRQERWRSKVRDHTVVIGYGTKGSSAVLTTLTVRRLTRRAVIVASVREAENAALLRESGASSVVTSSDTAGQLLGVATISP
jgi:voltage-gated potassium channel